LRSKVNGVDIWHGSALFTPEQTVDTLRHWRKKVRQNRLHLTSGSPNLTMGVYREYNAPVPLMLISELHAYGSGNRKSVVKTLRKNIKGLGKKRAYGYGKVIAIESEETKDDYSLVADGVSMRWLPSENGTRLVRACPPYWNNTDRVQCLEVGENVSGEKALSTEDVKKVCD
jgi:CRISPR type IV-associated protein Csf3